MSIKKLVVCEENIIGIREFMSEYLNVQYDKDERLTHYEMQDYLIEKGHPLPKRVSFDRVKENDINTGQYLVVREESKRHKKGRKLIYENPIPFRPKDLLNELNTSITNEQLAKTREKILNEEFDLGTDIYGNIVPKKELYDECEYMITSSINRQRKYILTNGRHLISKGRGI